METRKRPLVLAQESSAKRIRSHRLTSTEPDSSQDEFVDDESGSDSEMSVGLVSNPGTPLSPASSVRPSGQKGHKCPYEDCDKSFNRAARLIEHLRSHTGERPFACEVEGCMKTFRRQGHLNRHFASAHTSDRPYVCDVDGCSKAFLTAQRLRKHVDSHAGIERYRCREHPPCNETFRKHSTLQRHIDTVHLGKPAFVCSKPDANGILCGQGFQTAARLRAHEANHGTMRYFCNECGDLGFALYSEFQEHIKEFHRPRCQVCQQAFKTPALLSRHVEIYHENQPLAERKTHLCAECDKGFTKKSNLRAHIRAVHAKERNFVCGEFDTSQSRALEEWNGSNACGRKFGAKATLEEHIRTQHLGMLGTVKARKQANGETKPMVKKDTTMTSILTGEGYQEARKLVCPVANCKHRFKREYDRDAHLELKHGITDAPTAEQDQFRLGGWEDDDSDDEFQRLIDEKMQE